jgi:hypothetical protein
MVAPRSHSRREDIRTFKCAQERAGGCVPQVHINSQTRPHNRNHCRTLISPCGPIAKSHLSFTSDRARVIAVVTHAMTKTTSTVSK